MRHFRKDIKRCALFSCWDLVNDMSRAPGEFGERGSSHFGADPAAPVRGMGGHAVDSGFTAERQATGRSAHPRCA